MHNDHSVAAHWAGEFDEGRFRAWAEKLRSRLVASRVDLGLVFISPEFFEVAPQVLELIRVHAQVPLLAGCSSASLIAGGEEIEDEAGLVLGLYSLPGVVLRAVRFTQEQVDEASGPAYWHFENGVAPEQTNGWLCFADPFHLDCEAWLRGWNEAYGPLPVLGGLASSDPAGQLTQVYLNGEAFEEGGVANLGVRPTFGGVTQAVEAHLLDTSLDLYGKVLELAFAERLRDEMSFDGPDALLRQIRTDIESVRRVLGTAPNHCAI